MDVDALVASARQKAAVRSDAVVSDARVAELVNEAYAEVLGEADWPFQYVDETVTATGGESTVTLPVAFRSASSVLAARVRLDETRIEDLDEMDVEDREEQGGPVVYAWRDDRTIELWPAPASDMDVTVIGYRATSTLSGLDVPTFAAEFHPLLAYVAAGKLLAEFGDDSGRMDGFRAEASSILYRMTRRYLRTSDTGRIQIGGRALQRGRSARRHQRQWR